MVIIPRIGGCAGAHDDDDERDGMVNDSKDGCAWSSEIIITITITITITIIIIIIIII